MPEDLSPEQIERLATAIEKLNESMGIETTIRGKSGSELLKSVKSFDGLNKILGTTTRALGALKDGAYGASTYNTAMEDGARLFRGMAREMGVFAKGLSMAVTIGVKYVGAVTKQADALFKAYQDLNKFGGAGAGGMRDIFDNMQKFGYGIKELDQMQRLLAANSATLAEMGGIVSQGTKQFADLSAQIQYSDIGRSFMAAGMSMDAINESNALYLKQLVMLGLQQRKSTQEQVAGAAALTKEFDLLRRITGDTLEQQARKQQEILQTDVGNAILTKLEKIAPDAGQALMSFLQTVPEEFRNKLTQVAGGNVGLAAEMMTMMPETVMALQRVARGEIIDPGVLGDIMRREADVAYERFAGAGQLGVAKTFLGGEVLSVLNQLRGAAPMTERRAMAELDRLPIDKTVNNMVDMTRSQIDTRNALQSMVNLGIKPVTYGMMGLAGVISKITGIPAKIPGVGPAGGSMGGRTGIPGSFGSVSGAAAAPGAVGGMGAILNMIGQAESQGNYNVMFGGKTADLTNMTIAQVYELQRNMKAQGMESTAVGKYQFINATLKRMVKATGMDPNTAKFDQATQDKLAAELVRQQGYDKLQSGQITREQFLKNLSTQWAGLPTGPGGTSYYQGVGSNRATIGFQEAMGAISGPTGGYQNQMRGLAPNLPATGSAPTVAAQESAIANNNMQQLLPLVPSFQEMVRLQSQSVDLQKKMLQRTQ